MEERCVDDIAVANDPTNVRSGPPCVTRLDPVEGFHGPGKGYGVAAGRSDHALGLPRCTGRVQDVERIGARRVDASGRLDSVLRLEPVDVPSGREIARGIFPLTDQAELGLVLRDADRLVEEWLVGDNAVRFDPTGRREHGLGTRVVDPDRKLVCGKATEYDGMNGAKPRAGQHGYGRLRNHRHVDEHPIPLGNAPRSQRAGKPSDHPLQFGIGDGLLVPGNRAVVNDRGPVAMSRKNVAIDRVVAGVEDPVTEPLVEGRVRVVEGAGGTSSPVDQLRDTQPESLRVAFLVCVDGRIG